MSDVGRRPIKERRIGSSGGRYGQFPYPLTVAISCAQASFVPIAPRCPDDDLRPSRRGSRGCVTRHLRRQRLRAFFRSALRPEWNSLDDYAGALRKSYRRKHRRTRERGERIVRRQLSPGEILALPFVSWPTVDEPTLAGYNAGSEIVRSGAWSAGEMADIADGESVEVKGSAAKPYVG